MKKTLKTVLVFAVILAVLLGVAEVTVRVERKKALQNALPDTADGLVALVDENDATVIYLDGDSVNIVGDGVSFSQSKGIVTIQCPGTYCVAGSLTDGQIVVDCDDYHGAVCLLLADASVSCSDGPALYIKQADLTVLQLVEGTDNRLQDAAGYIIGEGDELSAGGAVYSADPLQITGDGALTVTGGNADGIRTKDELILDGGNLTVNAADDGLQACDYVLIEGGSVAVTAGGDGIATTEGYVNFSGGTTVITSAGDGVSANTDVTVTGGTLTVTAGGGSAHYADIAVADVSAKGIKGNSVNISGGVVSLDTADDGLNANQDIAVTGGTVNIASGDDAVHATGTIALAEGSLCVQTCYEGLEASTVTIGGGSVTIAADNNGVDAGSGGFNLTDGQVVIAAPCCVGTDGALSVDGGYLYLTATGDDSPLSFANASVGGGTVIACGKMSAVTFLADGEIPGSLLYTTAEELAAGTEITLYDSTGSALLSFQNETDCTAVLMASGALGIGQSYTLTAAEHTAAAVLSNGCVIMS